MANLRAIGFRAQRLPPALTYRSIPDQFHIFICPKRTPYDGQSVLLISMFGAPCPLLPVHAGEIQCRGLGMALGPPHPHFPDIVLSR